MPYEREVQPPRRWWLGWLQLLFAWVLCMLLCANIALALAEGLPAANAVPTIDRQAGCTNAKTTPQRETTRGREDDPIKAGAPRC